MEEPLVLIGDDRRTTWEIEPCWNDFTSFWSGKQSTIETQKTYPFVLDLRIPPSIKHHLESLGDVSRILVTQSFADLYQRLKVGLLLDDYIPAEGKINRPVPRHSGVLIQGQPGTGKSISLWFLAIRLLQDFPLEPLLFIQQLEAYLFYQGRAYVLPESKQLFSQKQLPTECFSQRNGERSCIALTEWGAASHAPHLDWNALFPVFASSPDVNRTRSFVKKKNPFIWGMPTWTRLELRMGLDTQKSIDTIKQDLDLAVTASVNDAMDIDSDDEDDNVEDHEDLDLPARAEPEHLHSPSQSDAFELRLWRFLGLAVQEVGWVPRDVYHYMADPQTCISEVQDGLEEMDAKAALLKIVGRSGPSGSISHRVFMEHARTSPPSETSNSTFVIHFRTTYAKVKFLEKLNSYNSANLKEVLDIATRYPEASALGGNIFDKIAHVIVPNLRDLELIPMVETTTVKGTTTSKSKEPQYVTYERSAECQPQNRIVVNFSRAAQVDIDQRCPDEVHVIYYYRGSHTTPLIDGFFVSQTSEHTVIDFIQVSKSPQKHSRSELGPNLVKSIIEKASLAYDLPILIRFVLIGDAQSEGSEVKWSCSSRLKDVLNAWSYQVWYTSIAVDHIIPVMPLKVASDAM